MGCPWGFCGRWRCTGGEGSGGEEIGGTSDGGEKVLPVAARAAGLCGGSQADAPDASAHGGRPGSGPFRVVGRSRSDAETGGGAGEHNRRLEGQEQKRCQRVLTRVAWKAPSRGNGP